jgi:hypothetical protein
VENARIENGQLSPIRVCTNSADAARDDANIRTQRGEKRDAGVTLRACESVTCVADPRPAIGQLLLRCLNSGIHALALAGLSG